MITTLPEISLEIVFLIKWLLMAFTNINLYVTITMYYYYVLCTN